MKPVHLIIVGKLKDRNLETIESDYLKRLNSFKLQIHEVKNHGSDQDIEAGHVLKKINDLSPDQNHELVLLSEFGKTYESPDFSKWFFNKLELNSKIIMVIAGALGHGEEVLKLKHSKLSLSPLTFPHKIARVILVEQLYRAQTIKSGHPYHH